MKTVIKVKTLAGGCLPKIIENGDWIDLYAAQDTNLTACQYQSPKKVEDNGVKRSIRNVTMDVSYIPLGVVIQLPDGYEAILASRSSTPKKAGVFIPSGIGIIDNSYCGPKDEWNFVCTPMKDTIIHAGDRVCQFRIQLSQKATFWQKLKWFFSSGIEIQEVTEITNPSRGGLGSTGV